ncbi:MAG: hypothetical protein NVS3B20_17360 [Polyangiales bacterium]
MNASEKKETSSGRRGRRIGQVVFFSLLVWVIASASAEVLGETLFAPRTPITAEACRIELTALRRSLADALMRDRAGGELAALRSFRNALSSDQGRTFDTRVLALVDSCPRQESSQAYALARLRAAEEAMVRIDAQEVAPARTAHERAMGTSLLVPTPGDSFEPAPAESTAPLPGTQHETPPPR